MGEQRSSSVLNASFPRCPAVDATINYTVSVVASDTKELRLDTNNLDIHRVLVSGSQVEFTLQPEVAPFGRALSIPLTDVAGGSTLHVSVTYSTTASSAALQWLTPEQTAGAAA